MARYVQTGNHLPVTFAGTVVPGTLIQIAGKAGIVDPKSDGSSYVAGEIGSATIRGVVAIAKGAVAFADGATVMYENSNDTAVAAGGDFNAGTAVGAAATGDAEVFVLLNGV